MERRITRRARRVRDLLATLPVIEAELLAATADGKVMEKVIHKLEQKELALVERVEDLEIELGEFRGMYCIPAPRSLTEEMELESRLSL